MICLEVNFLQLQRHGGFSKPWRRVPVLLSDRVSRVCLPPMRVAGRTGYDCPVRASGWEPFE